jgi:hypothetical protein
VAGAAYRAPLIAVFADLVADDAARHAAPPITPTALPPVKACPRRRRPPHRPTCPFQSRTSCTHSGQHGRRCDSKTRSNSTHFGNLFTRSLTPGLYRIECQLDLRRLNQYCRHPAGHGLHKRPSSYNVGGTEEMTRYLRVAFPVAGRDESGSVPDRRGL